MAAQKGSDFLLKIGDGVTPTEGFTTIGGFRSNIFKINNETINITNKDSGGKRELLAGGGMQSINVSGTGVFMDDVAFANTEAVVRANMPNNFQIIMPSFGTYEGSFNIATLEFAGEHNGEMKYSLSLESTGPIGFTAV